MLLLLLPLLLISLLGYLLAKTNWIRAGWAIDVGQLTAKLLIPVLLFNGAYKNGIPSTISWQVLCAFYLPLISVFLLFLILFAKNTNSAALALGASYSNTVFVGIPVLMQAFGKESLQYAFSIIVFHSLIAFTLYYLTAPNSLNGASKVFASLSNTLRNPIVVSLFFGMAFNLSAIKLPEFLLQSLTMLASAALPCALLSLGASLINFSLQSWRGAVSIVFTKLILFPMLVLGLAHYGFGLRSEAMSALVVLAACPVGVNAYSVVLANDGDVRLLSASILLSSLVCVGSIPAWLYVLSLI
jgi:malonate transporter